MTERLYVPQATPAPTDLYCWLWAAYPPHHGRLHNTRIATDLGISTRTLRRWLAEHDGMTRLTHDQRAQLSRRAILRGRGTYLWPLVDAAATWRVDRTLDQALYNLTMLNHPDRIPTGWHQKGYLHPHSAFLLHYPRAHVYSVAFARHDKHRARLHRHADVIEEQQAPNRWAALSSKLATLQAHRATHCVTPRGLVPTGHTETLRQTRQPPDLVTTFPYGE